MVRVFNVQVIFGILIGTLVALMSAVGVCSRHRHNVKLITCGTSEKTNTVEIGFSRTRIEVT